MNNPRFLTVDTADLIDGQVLFYDAVTHSIRGGSKDGLGGTSPHPTALVVTGNMTLSAADVAPPVRAIRGSPSTPFTLVLPSVAFIVWLVNQTNKTATIDSPGATADTFLAPGESALFLHVP